MKYKNLPIYVDFSLTSQCNLNCSFCYASSNSNIGEIKELGLNDIEKVFNELDVLEILRVGFEGGEPFLRDDIIEIFEMADTHKFEYFVNTNGTLIDKQMAEKISKTGIAKVCVSIDGPNAEIHDLCRGKNGSFAKSVQAIKFLQEFKVNTEAVFTASKLNFNYIVETILFLYSIGINKVAIMVLANVGSAQENLNEVYLNYEEWSNFLIEISKFKKNLTYPIKINIVTAGESLYPWEIYLPLKQNNLESYMAYWISKESIISTNLNEFGCTAAKDNIAIDGKGNVYGCSFMISSNELIAGNIKNESLIEIWHDSEIFRYIRSLELKNVLGPCKECEFLSKCKAGCRACAFSSSKNLLSSDIRCPFYLE